MHRRPGRDVQKRRFCRLRLEPLEDRALLSTLTPYPTHYSAPFVSTQSAYPMPNNAPSPDPPQQSNPAARGQTPSYDTYGSNKATGASTGTSSQQANGATTGSNQSEYNQSAYDSTPDQNGTDTYTPYDSGQKKNVTPSANAQPTADPLPATNSQRAVPAAAIVASGQKLSAQPNLSAASSARPASKSEDALTPLILPKRELATDELMVLLSENEMSGSVKEEGGIGGDEAPAFIKEPPQIAGLLVRAMPFDVAALQQNVERFFEQVANLGEDSLGVQTGFRLAPWFATVSGVAVALELARRRMNQTEYSLVWASNKLSTLTWPPRFGADPFSDIA
jgi:hypothetical protein